MYRWPSTPVASPRCYVRRFRTQALLNPLSTESARNRLLRGCIAGWILPLTQIWVSKLRSGVRCADGFSWPRVERCDDDVASLASVEVVTQLRNESGGPGWWSHGCPVAAACVLVASERCGCRPRGSRCRGVARNRNGIRRLLCEVAREAAIARQRCSDGHRPGVMATEAARELRGHVLQHRFRRCAPSITHHVHEPRLLLG